MVFSANKNQEIHTKLFVMHTHSERQTVVDVIPFESVHTSQSRTNIYGRACERANEYLQFFHLNVKLDYPSKCNAFAQRMTFASLTDVDSQTGQRYVFIHRHI